MEHSIGQSALDVICSIVTSLTDIDRVEFVCLQSRTTLLQDRINVTPPIDQVLNRALALRQQTHLPFWDSVMVSTFGCGEKLSQLFDAALHHNPTPKHSIKLDASLCTADRVTSLFSREACNDEVLAFTSAVWLKSGAVAHVPMIDFHLPRSPENDGVALTALAAIAAGPGYLLRSDKSYHFIGSKVIEPEMLSQFLARCLLLSPVVDRSWVAHQLIEGRCALRVSARRDGGAGAPKVIALT